MSKNQGGQLGVLATIGILVALFWFPPRVQAVNQACNLNLRINEFAPRASTEWIELVNNSSTTSCDLDDYLLVSTDAQQSFYNELPLTGTLPRYGFLTIDLTADYLPDDGACLVIFVEGTNTSVVALRYGNKDCDNPDRVSTVTDLSSLTSTGSISSDEQQNGSWSISSSPTKGWCNSSSRGCPAIATITSGLAAEGVSTNLGTQADYSRTNELYFEKSENGSPVGRITFLQEINFTDRDALAWMAQLDSKLSISQGIISLDADLINDLVNTSAQLTMYNISLTNPKILVDGQEDTAGIVSGLSYNRSAGTLTFTAAHFTTFAAVESSSTSTAGTSSPTVSPVTPPGCGDLSPGLKTPFLYLARTDQDSAWLYFTPADDPVSDYYLVYGLKPGEERYAVSFPYGSSRDVIAYQVKDLAPNQEYYFKVRAGNGCASGGWSNEIKLKTAPLPDLPAAKVLSKKTRVLGAKVASPTVKLRLTPTPPPKPVQKLQPTPRPTPVPSAPAPAGRSGLLTRILKAIFRLFGQ